VGVVHRTGGEVPGVFVIVRDARGSVVHVRRRDDGECIGCIEVGLFEIVRSIIVAETEETTAGRDRLRAEDR